MYTNACEGKVCKSCAASAGGPIAVFTAVCFFYPIFRTDSRVQGCTMLIN
ncbi:MAG: hypothetical protein IJJ76_13940 [Ruminococcus sp.]|nr:hypothetical protein [Ruminococcus sp.]MBR0530851.1 hypothetical protein [Ruminococcus sp.]